MFVCMHACIIIIMFSYLTSVTSYSERAHVKAVQMDRQIKRSSKYYCSITPKLSLKSIKRVNTGREPEENCEQQGREYETFCPAQPDSTLKAEQRNTIILIARSEALTNNPQNPFAASLPLTACSTYVAARPRDTPSNKTSQRETLCLWVLMSCAASLRLLCILV